jgi:hypothetical protein
MSIHYIQIDRGGMQTELTFDDRETATASFNELIRVPNTFSVEHWELPNNECEEARIISSWRWNDE